jgi:hypothetical protein
MKHGKPNTHPPTTALKIHPQSNGFWFASLHFNSIQNEPASIRHTLNNYQVPNPVSVNVSDIKRALRTEYGVNPWLNSFTILCINSVRTSQETHYVTATKPNRLMPFKETVAVYCENHMEHINTLCGQNAKFWYVKAGGTYSDHWVLKG